MHITVLHLLLLPLAVAMIAAAPCEEPLHSPNLATRYDQLQAKTGAELSARVQQLYRLTETIEALATGRRPIKPQTRQGSSRSSP